MTSPKLFKNVVLFMAINKAQLELFIDFFNLVFQFQSN